MSIAFKDATELTSQEWATREQVLRIFEDAWRHGLRPALEDHLPEDGRGRRAVLVELVHTDLEYRLLLFLYGRLDRVCDKYAIVEAVWGQDYVDKVDDGRIEKLISRLRQKVEPDPAHPDIPGLVDSRLNREHAW